jgi:hypothetical protein
VEALVSTVGALVAALCAVLLLRAYIKVRTRLLLWSGLCFAGLFVSNALIFVDLHLYPMEMNLYMYRLVIAAAAMMTLLFGLVLDSE